jgi:polyisoprenoid-binding protein YceI
MKTGRKAGSLTPLKNETMKRILFPAVAAIMLAVSFAFALPQNWNIATKYNISFTTSGVSGIFKTFTGAIVFDDQNPAASKFDVSIDVNSINTGNGMMNKHAKGADWFDAAKYPAIRFVSTKFLKVGNAYQVTGNLSIHGITKPYSIPFTFKRNGSGGSFEGTFNVNRNDFKIGDPGGEVGEVIKLVVAVPVTKK